MPKPKWKADDPLCADLAGPKSLLRQGASDEAELVLGIRPNGASYLHLSVDQMRTLIRRYPTYAPFARRDPFPASEFISLSPICFRTEDELKRKLAKYEVRYKKGQRVEYDNSQANSYYASSSSAEGSTRAIYEQQRVIYRLIQDSIDLSKFSLRDSSWMSEFKVLSFSLNVWIKDVRTKDERDRDPRILDCGWYEADLLAPTAPNKVCHFEVHETRGLQNGRSVKRKKLSDTETLPLNELRTKLKELFSSLEKTILFVYDREKVSTLLHFFDIDATQWQTGDLHSFLYHSERYRHSPNFNPRDPRSRRRSLSPRRSTSSRERPYSPLHAARPSSIYMVDIKSLCSLLHIMGPSLKEDAQGLGIDTDPNEMCAADDAQLLIRMWMAVAAGATVDEQAELRREHNIRRYTQPSSSNYGSSSPVRQPTDEDVDPNDIDPNDIVPGPSSSSDANNVSHAYSILDEEEDFEDDY